MTALLGARMEPINLKLAKDVNEAGMLACKEDKDLPF